MKNVLLAHTFRVLFWSDTYEGSTHDKSIADATPYPLPQESELLDELGFLGYERADVRHPRPTRKPKGGELTADQKEHNRQVARRRAVIENILRSIKRCRILKDTIRLWKDDVRDLVMEICCGLHNFRLRLNPWPARSF